MSVVSLSRSLISSRQIFHFLALVDHGSLSRAAKVVSITEPALSKSIRSLEQYLQAPLFDRTPTGLVLTAFGHLLVQHARVIAAEFRHVAEEVARLRGVHTGYLHVGASPTFVQSLLPEAIARFRDDHVGVHVRVREDYLNGLLRLLQSGELDFAVTVLEAVGFDKDIQQEVLFQDEIGVIGRKDHPLLLEGEPSLEEIASAAWTMPGRDDKLTITLDKIFRDNNVVGPDVMVEAASTNFVRQMILKSDYLTFAPTGLYRREIESGLVKVLEHPAPFRRTAGFVYRRNASLSPSALRLMENIRFAAAAESG